MKLFRRRGSYLAVDGQAAKWIARDALKELTSDNIQKKLKSSSRSQKVGGVTDFSGEASCATGGRKTGNHVRESGVISGWGLIPESDNVGGFL